MEFSLYNILNIRIIQISRFSNLVSRQKVASVQPPTYKLTLLLWKLWWLGDSKGSKVKSPRCSIYSQKSLHLPCVCPSCGKRSIVADIHYVHNRYIIKNYGVDQGANASGHRSPSESIATESYGQIWGQFFSLDLGIFIVQCIRENWNQNSNIMFLFKVTIFFFTK